MRRTETEHPPQPILHTMPGPRSPYTHGDNSEESVQIKDTLPGLAKSRAYLAGGA